MALSPFLSLDDVSVGIRSTELSLCSITRVSVQYKQHSWCSWSWHSSHSRGCLLLLVQCCINVLCCELSKSMVIAVSRHPHLLSIRDFRHCLLLERCSWFCSLQQELFASIQWLRCDVTPRSICAPFLHLRHLCTERNRKETAWYDAMPTLTKLNSAVLKWENHLSSKLLACS